MIGRGFDQRAAQVGFDATQVYLEEKKGNIDYLGWTGRQDKHDDGVTLATIKFARVCVEINH